jgi:ABC-type branched-subunit amino acid transport system substrate-binding protein
MACSPAWGLGEANAMNWGFTTTRPWAGLATLAFAGLLAASCGTTVPASRTGAAGGGPVGEGLTPGATGVGDSPAATPSTGSAGTAQGSASAGTGPGYIGGPAIGSPDLSSPSSVGVSPPQQPGTATPASSGPISIGIEDVNLNSAGGAALGGASPISVRAQYQAVVDDINGHGGIKGRKLRPVYVQFDLAGNSPAVQEQAECTAWTQDNRVVAVLLTFQHTPLLYGCLRKAGTMALGVAGVGTADTDGALFDQNPNFVSGGVLEFDRVVPLYVNSLATQGFFTTGAKVGVLYNDTPQGAFADSLLKSVLGQRGLHVSKEAAVPLSFRVQDEGNTQSAVESAVLQFHAAGVDHVMFLTTSALTVSSGFMRYAASQGWTPRYGMSSAEGFPQPQSGSTASSPYAAPVSQLHGIVGVSWAPAAQGVDPRYSYSPRAKQCIGLLESKGVSASAAETGGGLTACDEVWLFQAAAEATGLTMTGASLISGANQLGDFPSAAQFLLHYDPSHHDGTAEAANMAYDDGCTCYRFTSAPFRI